MQPVCYTWASACASVSDPPAQHDTTQRRGAPPQQQSVQGQHACSARCGAKNSLKRGTAAGPHYAAVHFCQGSPTASKVPNKQVPVCTTGFWLGPQQQTLSQNQHNHVGHTPQLLIHAYVLARRSRKECMTVTLCQALRRQRAVELVWKR